MGLGGELFGGGGNGVGGLGVAEWGGSEGADVAAAQMVSGASIFIHMSL